MCWEALATDTWLLVSFAPNHHNMRFVAFLPVTGRKAKIGKGCPFQVFYTKQHFLPPLVHSIIDFWSGVFNIGLLVSFLPVTGVHWENVCQNTLNILNRGLFTNFVSQNVGFIDPSSLLCQQWSAFGWPQSPLPRQKWPSFGCPPLRQHLPDALFVLFLSLFFDVICD